MVLVVIAPKIGLIPPEVMGSGEVSVCRLDGATSLPISLFHFGERGSTVLAPIIKEVLMFRTSRVRPGFDVSDSMVLVSGAVITASSAATADNPRGAHLELNGTLHANKTVPVGDDRTNLAADSRNAERRLSTFETSGRLTTLGKVSGSFGLVEDSDTPWGELPNLSNLTLDLCNHAGSVRLTLSPSPTNRYQFRLSGGTGSYSAAYGSGSLTITFRHSSNEYLLRVQSTRG